MTILDQFVRFTTLVALTSSMAGAFNVQGGQRVFVSTPAPKFPKRVVADYMDPVSYVLTPDMSIDEALKAFVRLDLTAAPVVDGSTSTSNKILVGIVSSSDFLQKEAFEGALLPMGGDGCSTEIVQRYMDAAKKICGQKVEDVMTSNPITVRSTTPMRDAAALMSQHHFQRLPVVETSVGDDNQQQLRLVGMLTTSHVMQDLLYVMNQLPPASDIGMDTTIDQENIYHSARP